MTRLQKAVAALDKVVRANPKKFFSWDTSRIPNKSPSQLEFMVGLTYGEWMEWDQQRREDFVEGLHKLGFPDSFRG